SFPSESSFHHHHQHNSVAPPPAPHRASYYEHSSSSSYGTGGNSSHYGSAGSSSFSFVRGGHDGYASHQHHHAPSQYDAPPSHYQSHLSNRRDENYESSASRSSAQMSEEVKYAYAAAGITPTPEFTGEELSAVLELMKDS
uniref:Uncharacterized protein n=1 Tax=Globisporangium ultimum (strain ATCC 200006 / CBS 805.95 / DAOM BR144) TaxID=431595 RepID=K3X9K6_GLOUD